MQAYHDDGMGRARARLPRPVGEADARRLPGRARLDHRAAQARRLPRGLRRLRSGEGRPLRRGATSLRLLDDPGIIRSRAKIEATIGGARIYCEMADRGEDFADFCWSFTGGKVLKGDGRSLPAKTDLSETISKELKRRGFKFVGPTIVYAWMQAVGIVNDHAVGCFRREQV